MDLLFPLKISSPEPFSEGNPDIRRQLQLRRGQPIVIVKFSGWGTLLGLFPFFEQLRHNYPDNPVVLVTGQENRPMLTHFSPVDHVLYPRGHQKLSAFDAMRLAFGVARLRPALLIDLQIFTRKKLSLVLSRISGSPVRIGFVDQKSSIPFSGLTHPFFHNRHLPPAKAIDQIAGLLGLRTELSSKILKPPGGLPEKHLRSLQEIFFFPTDKIIVINPNASAQSHERRWPPEFFGETARKLLERHADARMAFIGLDRDKPHVRSILGNIPTRFLGRVINLAGRLSFSELHALLGTCDGYLGNDSGPLHLALLSGAPSVGIFGPTHPDHVLPPGNFPHALFLYEPHYCSPCVHHASALPCGGENHCMQSISPTSVVHAMESLVWSLGEKTRLRHLWARTEKSVRTEHTGSPLALYRERGE